MTVIIEDLKTKYLLKYNIPPLDNNQWKEHTIMYVTDGFN